MEMRSILILVLVSSLYSRVKCESGSAFGYEILISEIEQLKSNQKNYEQQLMQSKQQTETLQAQLHSKNANLKQLEQKVSQLSTASAKFEEKYQAQNEKHRQDTEQLKLNQKTLQQQLGRAEQQTSTTQDQLQKLSASLTQLQQQVAKDIKARTVLLSSNYQWVSWSASSEIPKNAISIGRGWDDGALYVGRIHHKGSYFVAKASPKDKKCYLAYDGNEIDHSNCEVLTGSGLSWEWSPKGGALPANSFPCGSKANGESQYIGYMEHTITDLPDSRSPGTIQLSDKSLSISFHRKVYKLSRSDYGYYVLVMN